MDNSFLVKSKNLSQETINSLDDWLITATKENISTEIIVYSNRQIPYQAKHVRFAKSSKGFSAVQHAVVLACGKNIAFTTSSNILSKSPKQLIGDIPNVEPFSVAVQIKQNMLTSIFGYRSIANAPYVVANSVFAKSHSNVFKNYVSAIKKADRSLALLKLAENNTYPESVIGSVVFSRPYKEMLRRLFISYKQKYVDYKEKRRVERLRRQVPDVPYNASMPVFIVCRDRVEPLKKLIKWLEAEGLHNIYLLDNASTYPKLLEYYSKTPYEVIRLNANIGHTSPWVSGAVQTFAKNKPFIVTDPDVLPVSNSHGAVKRFCQLLTAHPERTKAGFGLKIDDLPDEYELKDYVIAWEKQFWVSKVEEDVYDAEIDTTFAVYRQNTPYVLGPGLRTGGDFVARHEPWYINSKHISEEVLYYRSHANKAVGSWGVTSSDVTPTYKQHKTKQSLGK